MREPRPPAPRHVVRKLGAARMQAALRQTVVLGLVPSQDPGTEPTEKHLTESALRWLDMVGLDPASIGRNLAISPTCGLAGASDVWTRRALALLRASAVNLTD